DRRLDRQLSRHRRVVAALAADAELQLTRDARHLLDLDLADTGNGRHADTAVAVHVRGPGRVGLPSGTQDVRAAGNGGIEDRATGAAGQHDADALGDRIDRRAGRHDDDAGELDDVFPGGRADVLHLQQRLGRVDRDDVVAGIAPVADAVTVAVERG